MKRDLLRRLELNEFQNIYESEMKRDFPAAELKSIAHIERLIGDGIYTVYGLFEDAELIAYALIALDSNFVLLDYLAVCASRGKGYGSRMLSALGERYADRRAILGEIELPEAAVGAERATREKRYDFYVKNGWRKTRVAVCQFGEILQIFCLDRAASPADAEIENAVAGFYDLIYGDDSREGRVSVLGGRIP